MSIGYWLNSMVSEVPLVSVGTPGVWRLLARFHGVCRCPLVSGGYCPDSMVSEVPLVSVGTWILVCVGL